MKRNIKVNVLDLIMLFLVMGLAIYLIVYQQMEMNRIINNNNECIYKLEKLIGIDKL